MALCESSRDNVHSSSFRSEFTFSLQRGSKLKLNTERHKSVNHSFQFHIDEQDEDRRVDDFFASRFGMLSRMRIANLINAGACLVNGAAAKPGTKIVPGDCVEVSFDDGSPTSMDPQPIPLEIVFEDDHMIVVVKPAGMLVHPTLSVKTGTLANALAYHFNKIRIEAGGWRMEELALGTGDSGDPQSSILHPQPIIRPGIVHRLDRETSGLIAVAKTPRALTVLSRHFRKRLVEKRYLALVHGVFERDSGTIDAPIGRDGDQRPHWRVMDSGKPAQTRFITLERLERATLVELEPVTGRTNQLRIHCAHIGHPIVGDQLHCGNQQALSDIRLCLHAWKLALHHPASGEWMEFTTPAPDEIVRVVKLFR
jgi:23S rRNA pseudouridine1911/1915/1917 synthase